MLNSIQIKQLRFCYEKGKTALSLDELNIKAQSLVFIKGKSGSGKSTLLNLLTGMLVPTSGEITVLGERLDQMSARQRDAFRSDHIGYIFQQFNLIPYLSVVENVILPCQFSKRRMQKINQGLIPEAQSLLESLQLDKSLWDKKVSDLSVGQQQRVAAARAFIGSPELIIADEPTSALDHDNREAFIELLFTEAKRTGASLVFVSHDPTLEHKFEQVIGLEAINHH